MKPAHVFLLADGQVKILDFGLARSATHAEKGATQTQVALTDAGTILGTAGYMAPEQVRGVPVDGRADLFALGVVLYETVTGKRPFSGDSTYVADVVDVRARRLQPSVAESDRSSQRAHADDLARWEPRLVLGGARDLSRDVGRESPAPVGVNQGVVWLTDVSSDGTWLYHRLGPRTAGDIWVLPLSGSSGEPTPMPWRQSPAHEVLRAVLAWSHDPFSTGGPSLGGLRPCDSSSSLAHSV